MGHNTTLVILNDSLDDIRNDKDFGKKVHDAICNFRKEPITIFSGHGDAARVIEMHHSSHDVLIKVGGNTGEVVDPVYTPKTNKKQKHIKTG